ncbi:hypothetical protein M432DRAFT_398984 [Thermoascus aurantiacus ATCC 26904]
MLRCVSNFGNMMILFIVGIIAHVSEHSLLCLSAGMSGFVLHCSELGSQSVRNGLWRQYSARNMEVQNSAASCSDIPTGLWLNRLLVGLLSRRPRSSIKERPFIFSGVKLLSALITGADGRNAWLRRIRYVGFDLVRTKSPSPEEAR